MTFASQPLSLARRLLIGSALLFAFGAHAEEPVTIGAAKFDAKVEVGGQQLLLNGAGIRTKLVFKVYAAGLYLPKHMTQAQEVVGANVTRRIHVHMLRDIDAKELGKLFTAGMEKNASREEFAKALGGAIRMGELFAEKKRLSPGETFTLDYIPGSGTTISINGKPIAGGPIREPEFFSALLKIWLGGDPADRSLKEAMLAGKIPATGAKD